MMHCRVMGLSSRSYPVLAARALHESRPLRVLLGVRDFGPAQLLEAIKVRYTATPPSPLASFCSSDAHRSCWLLYQ